MLGKHVLAGCQEIRQAWVQQRTEPCRRHAMMFPTMATHAIAEPGYEVIRTLRDVELRRYAPYVVAEVQVEGPAQSAGSKAFPILAGYIFGKNKGERRLAMTTPVTQAAAPVKLAMTAPVTQALSEGGYLVQFVLPAGVTLATAPEPLDARVHVRQLPGREIAVIRYSGFWSEANYDQHLKALQQALRAANVHWSGEPVYARYNAPFTPWFLRRNEIWLPLGAPAG